MIIVASLMLLCLTLAFPISLKGIDRETCNLNKNEAVHLVFLIFVGLFVVFSDVQALLTYSGLKHLKEEQVSIKKTGFTSFRF